MGTVIDIIKNFLLNIISKAYYFVVELINGKFWWIALLGLLLVAFLLIAGLVWLISKSWKALLVLLVLGLIGVAVWYFAFYKKQNPTETTTTETILSFLYIFKTLI